MVWFSRETNIEILRFACSRFIGDLSRSYLWNNHVRGWGKQDLGEGKVKLQAFETVTTTNPMGSSGTGMFLQNCPPSSKGLGVCITPSISLWMRMAFPGRDSEVMHRSQHPWQLKNWVPQSQSSSQVVFLNIHQKTNNQNNINLRILFQNTCVFHIYL